MKILHTVEFYSPSVGGAQEVVRQLSEHLVMLGHEVTVATTNLPDRLKKTLNGVKIVEFDVSGNAVRGYSGTDIEKYKRFLVKGGFDVIMNYAAQQWTADLAFEALDKIKARKIFVPCGYSGLYDPSYAEYFASMPDILRQYDKVVYLSHDYRDINFAKEHKIRNGIVIPNGADEREFSVISEKSKIEFRKKWNIAKDDKLILCVGTHTGVKGHDEAITSFQKAKIKNAILMIIGDTNKNGGCYSSCLRKTWIFNKILSKIDHLSKRIQVSSLSRVETITAFTSSDLFLFLSNIECSPLVLFEAAASGTPFLASRAGNSEEIADWTKAGLIVQSRSDRYGYASSDTGDAAKYIKKLLDDPKLCERMGKSGRTAWFRKYTWKKIADKYQKIYEEN